MTEKVLPCGPTSVTFRVFEIDRLDAGAHDDGVGLPGAAHAGGLRPGGSGPWHRNRGNRGDCEASDGDAACELQGFHRVVLARVVKAARFSRQAAGRQEFSTPRRSSTAWPRFGTSTVRSKLMNTVPSAFRPVVRTVTTPWVGRLADSRFASTSDSA